LGVLYLEQLKVSFILLNQYFLDQLKEYFELFGLVLECSLLTDKSTGKILSFFHYSKIGKPRGFGFVTMDSKDVVDSILSESHHIINGKKVGLPLSSYIHHLIFRSNAKSQYRKPL
jgi:RNA recognition motif-containing protein